MTTYAISYTYGRYMTTTRRERCGWGTRDRIYVPGQVRRFRTRAEAERWVEAGLIVYRSGSGYRECVTLDDLRLLGWSRNMIADSVELAEAVDASHAEPALP